MEDPAIKLFGKKIVLPGTTKTTNPPAISSAAGDDPTITGGRKNLNSDDPISHSCLEGEKVNRAAAEKDQLRPNYSEIKPESDNPKTPSIDEETRTEESQETKQESANKKCKNVKKPDKILPCPRCTSMDTKFCYYNNYNVNQPRHFCKSCQRYWTAGGTMRNMPVGAGRRKIKNPAAIKHYISNISQTVTVTTSDSIPKDIQIHRIPGASWPYIQIPAICSPVTAYPSSYCNCIPIMPPSTPTVTDSVTGSILGKRSLQMKFNDCEDELSRGKSTILVPKTLRIDDPDEAARSSIWATLGIKNENFKAFQEKRKEVKKHRKLEEMESTMCPELQANPAAFSRSLCFQETA